MHRPNEYLLFLPTYCIVIREIEVGRRRANIGERGVIAFERVGEGDEQVGERGEEDGETQPDGAFGSDRLQVRVLGREPLLPLHLLVEVAPLREEVRRLRASRVALGAVEHAFLRLRRQVRARFGHGEHDALQRTVCAHDLYLRRVLSATRALDDRSLQHTGKSCAPIELQRVLHRRVVVLAGVEGPRERAAIALQLERQYVHVLADAARHLQFMALLLL